MHIKTNKYVALFVAVLFVVLSTNIAFAADADVSALMAKISALESKVAQLEGKVANKDHVSPVSSVSSGDGLLKAAQDIQVSGFVSTSYNLNSNSPVNLAAGTGTNNANGNNTNVRLFERDANSFTENAKLTLAKQPTEKGSAGFRADLIFGRMAQILNSVTQADSPDNTYIEQAYVNYIAPIGNGLEIKAGRFVTFAGAEVLESKDNWNSSRGLLYTNAIPVGHNGVLGSYSLNDKVNLRLGVANGWDSSVDNNNGKTILSGVDFKPFSNLTLTQNFIIGPEQSRATTAGLGNKPDRNTRGLLDTIILWQPIKDNDRFKTLLNFDYGWEEKARAVVGGNNYSGEGLASWHGLALGTKYDVNSWLTLAGRWEYFQDTNGARLGAINGITRAQGNTLYEMTYTADVKLAKNLLTRFEWRYDWATNSIFDLSNSTTDTIGTTNVGTGGANAQHTIGAEVIYAF